MPMTQIELTEVQKAAMVARFVELHEVAMTRLEARLLVPRTTALNATAWDFKYEKTATFRFDEETKVIAVDLALDGAIVGLLNPKDQKKQRLASMSCSFNLEYSFNAKGGPEGQERHNFFLAFANINGLYNAWPYFREALQSTAARLGFPPVVLRVHRVSTSVPNDRPKLKEPE